MNYLGDFLEDSIVDVFFTTHDKDGASVAPSSAFESADIAIYKDGSATQKLTTNGLTMNSPFDAIVGVHQLRIDTSNDTGDVGFWAAGSNYMVLLNPDETIDGELTRKVLASFSLERLSDTVARLVTVEGKIDVIDAIVDAILVDTGTDIPASIAALPTVALIHNEVIEGTLTFKQAMRVLVAYAAGKASGGGTASIKFRNQADALDRITMTVDSSGNRSAVALNLA